MRVITAADLVTAQMPVDDGLRRRAEASATVTVAGVTMTLHSDDAALCAAFDRRFRAHRSNRVANFDYYVVRDRGGYVFFGDDSPAFYWPHCELTVAALLFLTDAAAISALIRFDERLVSYHAAAVERNGAAAAIVADSEGGKTTTALACARIGMRVYSDERLLIRDNVVHPFLRTCNVRPDGMQRLLRDDATDSLARALPETAEADLSFVDVFGDGAAAPPAPLRAVFLIQKDGTARASATRITPYDALPALMRWASARGDGLSRAARTTAMLSRCACYRLSLGTPSETARCIDETVRR